MAQYDSIVVKSGIACGIGTDALRADRTALAGLDTTTNALAPGDACQVSAALTLKTASVLSASSVVGIYDGVTGSVVREGMVVAAFKSGVVLADGDTVYLSSDDGKLTNVKPTKDMLHEVGVVVDAATKRVLLQQKPVLALPASPPISIWAGGLSPIRQYRQSDGALLTTCDYNNQALNVLWDGNYIWSSGNGGQTIKVDPFTNLKVGGPWTIGRTGHYFPMAFDGTNYWCPASDTSVTKFDANGNVLITVGSLSNCYCDGVMYDGVGNIWALSGRDGSIAYKISTTSNTVVGSCALAGCQYRGPGYSDKTYLWLSTTGNSGAPDIYLRKIRISDATLVNSWYIRGGWVNAWNVGGVVFDGAYLWVACWDGSWSRLVKMDTSGNVLWTSNSYSVAEAIFFDGTYIWASSSGTYSWRIKASDNSFSTWDSNGWGGVCDCRHVLPWP